MELRDFIKTTLKEITHGIKEAQNETQGTGVLINPSGVGVGNNGDKYLRSDGWRYVQQIEMKVAVTITTGEGSKAGLGVVTGFFSAGASMSSTESNNTVSVIQFTIPVAFPTEATPTEYKSRMPTDKVKAVPRNNSRNLG